MKKLIFVLALAFIAGAFIGCTQQENQKVHTRYTAAGRYYTDGTLITNDGHEWGYFTDIISEKMPYDNMPVYAGFDDNGTPDNITDDIILGLVYDRNTAIYDALEEALSNKFTVERDNNNLKISRKAEMR